MTSTENSEPSSMGEECFVSGGILAIVALKERKLKGVQADWLIAEIFKQNKES